MISIDLGSSFTKIAIRTALNVQAELVRGLPVARSAEENYCIPSVVGRIESAADSRWVVGVDAASLHPGPDVRVFSDWKRSLFPLHEHAISFPDKAEAVGVAVEFFRQIRRSLRRSHGEGIDEFPVRVAIPAFQRQSVDEDLISAILVRAGWSIAGVRPTVFEPESNALGFLSRGRNQTWKPRRVTHQRLPETSIQMQRMLEPGLSTAFRSMLREYGVLVTDIGAFTTDFGYVRFDSSFKSDEWGRPEVLQRSIRLGVHQLDEEIVELLEPEVRQFFHSRPTTEWERVKRNLYVGNPQKLVLPTNRSITIGEGVEGEAIQDAIERFAMAIVNAREGFCSRDGVSEVHEETITGGGSAIPALRLALIKHAIASGRRVHDLWDHREPELAIEAGAGRMSSYEQDERRVQNRLLVRGGSAVGGASVFFG